MKRTFLMIALAMGSMFVTNAVKAQVNVSVNIGSQPLWGPTGYDRADYYYIPDAGVYFDIARNLFVYRQGNAWATGASLPGSYGNIDLYRAHKVVINSPSPWLHDNVYRGKYKSYRGRFDQTAIRDAHDNKYYANPQHPHHSEWNGGGRNDHHGNGNGHDDHRGDRR
ncbi:hypothetical protein ACTHGU_10245 [Chitinophagaceae bacterium MMS25-I14]